MMVIMPPFMLAKGFAVDQVNYAQQRQIKYDASRGNSGIDFACVFATAFQPAPLSPAIRSVLLCILSARQSSSLVIQW
jgi:hypothetical protein